MSERSVHFTFGPVQDFLAEARRTRDLWAGSYLLSYLAASALVAAEGKAGTEAAVAVPFIADNPIVAALRKRRDTRVWSVTPEGAGVRIGSIPHIAEVAPAGEHDPRAIAKAATDGWDVMGWDTAWKTVANAVRTKLHELKLPWTSDTERMWNRQVNHFWTKTWVLGDAKYSAWRKSLRSFNLEPEPGEKCTCCGARQALTSGANDRRQAVITFWKAIDPAMQRIEVRADGAERLCAICAIKRFYPLVAEQAIGWKVEESLGFPSTVTLAGIPWRKQVVERGATCQALREAVRSYVAVLAEKRADSGSRPMARFEGLADMAKQWDADEPTARRFLHYDSVWFYPDELRDPERTPLPPDPDVIDPANDPRRADLQRALGHLLAATSAAGIPDAGTSYALLAMDGDNMGEALRRYADAGKKDVFSRVLDEFSQEVIGIVEGMVVRNGVEQQRWGPLGRLVYAGGDDVLALLPVTTALQVAEHIRNAYRDKLEGRLPPGPGEARPSISAGIVFAHMHAPLREVVRSAHRLLEFAKGTGGRDAFAVAVWKRAGIVAEFTSKWQQVASSTPFATDLLRLAGDIEPPTGEPRPYSRGFLYAAMSLLERMGKPVGPAIDTEQERRLLVAEYLKSRVHPGGDDPDKDRADADMRVKVLQHLTHPAVPGPLGRRTDPIRLALFLADGGA